MRNRLIREAFFCGLCLLFLSDPSSALFTLNLEPASFDFGALNVNSESSPQTVQCTVRSDIAMEWTLQLNVSPLTHTDGVTTFPSDHFRYWFNSDYAGTEAPAFPSNAQVPNGPTTVYTAAASEHQIDPGVYAISFKAMVNPVQKAGSYSTQIGVILLNNF